MSDWIHDRKVMDLKADIEGNLKMAEQFAHNPALEEKFLRQAIEAERKLKEYEA